MSKAPTVKMLAKRIFQDRMSAAPVYKLADEQVSDGGRLLDIWTPFNKPFSDLTLAQVEMMGKAWMLAAKLLQKTEAQEVANFRAKIKAFKKAGGSKEEGLAIINAMYGPQEPKRLN